MHTVSYQASLLHLSRSCYCNGNSLSLCANRTRRLSMRDAQLKRSGQVLKSCVEESATVASTLKIIRIAARSDRWSHLRSIFENHHTYDRREFNRVSIFKRAVRDVVFMMIVLFSAWYLLYNYYSRGREKDKQRKREREGDKKWKIKSKFRDIRILMRRYDIVLVAKSLQCIFISSQGRFSVDE